MNMAIGVVVSGGVNNPSPVMELTHETVCELERRGSISMLSDTRAQLCGNQGELPQIDEGCFISGQDYSIKGTRIVSWDEFKRGSTGLQPKIKGGTVCMATTLTASLKYWLNQGGDTMTIVLPGTRFGTKTVAVAVIEVNTETITIYRVPTSGIPGDYMVLVFESFSPNR